MHARIRYSEEYLKREFVEKGEELPAEEILPVPVEAISAEARAGLLEAPIGFEGQKKYRDLAKGAGRSHFFYAGFRPESAEDWERLILGYAARRREFLEEQRQLENEALRKQLARLEEIADGAEREGKIVLPSGYTSELGDRPDRFSLADDDIVERAQELWDSLKERWERQRKEESDRKLALKEAERARIEAEKKAWIEAHGSGHLRRAFAAGYDCQRLYVKERAAAEYPEYTVDFEDAAEWQERACPSPEALAEAERAGGRVVWLQKPAVEEYVEMDPEEMLAEEQYREDYGSPYPREAVVIEGYLGRENPEVPAVGRLAGYTLVREL